MNIRYGYDIRGEVVGEDGTAALGEPRRSMVRAGRPVAAGYRPTGGSGSSARTTSSSRSGSTRCAGGQLGPSSWDGYAAAVVSDAGAEALRTGERVAGVARATGRICTRVRRPA